MGLKVDARDLELISWSSASTSEVLQYIETSIHLDF